MKEDDILRKYNCVAIVGVSPNEDRDSNRVARYLSEHGYNVIPVNPNATQIIGKKCYPDLISIPQQVEIVDIFRKPEEVGPTADEAIKVGAKVIWMQEGIEHLDGTARARAAGLTVIQDRCILKEYAKRFVAEGI